MISSFRAARLSSGRYAILSPSGDFAFVTNAELDALHTGPQGVNQLPPGRVAELYAKHFLVDPRDAGMRRLLVARRAARRETVTDGASLHIFVPTLQCAHSCQYCQVSRTLDAEGASMRAEEVDLACETVFQSPSATLTVEFQGGDPLIRFDLIRRAIERIALINVREKRRVQFVVASTLHQLDSAMCDFFREHSVALSTSIDGPAPLHNQNRPLPGRDAYERTVRGIALARERIAPHSVSALMTTTRASLAMPEAIVDEYVNLGFDEIFVRPLSKYGFARRHGGRLGYSPDAFTRFYERCLTRVLLWNAEGVALREAAAAVWLNKLLSPFDAGYVDLQSPTGAGSAVVLYNYDGWVYPSDEARMLAETGDTSLRLGRIGEPLTRLLRSPIIERIRVASNGETHPECAGCPYHVHCGPDSVALHGAGGDTPVAATTHCTQSTWMFEHLLDRLDRAETEADDDFLDLAYAWARRAHPGQRGRSPGPRGSELWSPTARPADLSQGKFRIVPLHAEDSTG